MGLFAVRVLGWAVAIGDQLFCCASNQMTGTSVFAILNRVHQPRVEVMDGITLACMTDAGGVPTAGPIVMERVGDLTGDADADLARYEASLSDHPIAAEGSIAEEIREHIFFDVGPAAMSLGGDPVFMMRAMTSLSRGGPLNMQGTARLRAVR